MSTERTAEDIPREVEVTPEMIDAAYKAIEPYAFTSMDGYDMEKALPAAFRAMSELASKKVSRTSIVEVDGRDQT